MNAFNIRNKARMMGRRQGLFTAPRPCCTYGGDPVDLFCTEPGTISFTPGAGFSLYILTESGFFTVQDEDLNITVYPSDSDVFLDDDSGAYCFWSSDSEGVIDLGVITQFTIHGDYDEFDFSRVDGSIQTFEFTQNTLLSSVPVVSPSSLTTFVVAESPAVSSITLDQWPVLEVFTVFNMDGLLSIDYSSAPVLTTDITNVALLSSVETSTLVTVETFGIENAPSLTTLNFINSPDLSTLIVHDCTILDLFTVANSPLMTQIEFINCALSQSSVDNFVLYLDAVGFIGTMDLSGGTSASPSVGPPADAVANMILNGASITTN